MNKKGWKKSILALSICGIIIFIFPIVATYFIFNCQLFGFWKRACSPGDFLGYFASFFAMISTIIIAVYQSVLNKRLFEIEKKRETVEILSRTAVIRLKRIEGNFKNFNIFFSYDPTEVKKFEFAYGRCYSVNAKKVQIDSNKIEVCGVHSEFQSDGNVEVGGTISYSSFDEGKILTNGNKVDSSKIICSYKYQNIYGDEYMCVVTIKCKWGQDGNEILSCETEIGSAMGNN